MLDQAPSIAPAVRLPFARAASGVIRWARERRRDEACVCVGCGAPVQLRAGDVRRAHYAHAPNAPCSAETALHRGTIEILAAEIESASRARRSLLAPHACRDCDVVTMRDLARLTDLRAVAEQVVAVSPGGPSARPDLLVMRGPARRPAYAVEVVVTHAPEEEAREVLARLGLPIVIVRPSWDALAALELPLGSVSALGHVVIEGARCAGWRHPPPERPRCPGCRRAGLACTVQRWRGDACWRCGVSVPFADVRVHDERTAGDVDGWDGQPLVSAASIGVTSILVASSLGVRLAERWTYRRGRVELVHACPSCGSTQPHPTRGTWREPEAVVHAAWCRRCSALEPMGAPRLAPKPRPGSPRPPVAADHSQG